MFVKKGISMLLVVCLLVACVLTGAPTVHAAKKETPKRAIAIVFDNSGSMYLDGKQDWCRATYAMEVFASMLNTGDTLTIYPMWPIEVEGKTYTMESPFQITDASQSAKIREIYSPEAKGTPIETIDCAANGLQAATADEKYMIVLTDGDSFYLNGADLKSKTKGELDKRFKALAGPDMTVMYLGVGKQTVIPDTAESEYFTKKHAKDSANVLSALTEMCNKIFGRDTLPKNHINGNTIDFDISMSKVIVFVQGENVADLKVTGAAGLIGTQAGSTATKYSTKGTGRCESVPDTSLQGMMVTYTDCTAGQYNVEYSGKATSIEVYYEPDADLDFVFTDADGNDVDPEELYEGEYKVSFGMKDAKTGQLIESDLLGNPKYQGSYSINGQEVKIEHEGLSGEVPITLKMDDTFEADLTATYLGGYTISKDSTDFGWPEGGIKVAAMPAGALRLEISGGDRIYSLQTLESGQPYIAKVYYQGAQLTGAELEKVKLTWDPDTSHAEIKQTFADDHYELTLHYKNPESPKDTVCGKCKVTINAAYAAPGSDEATAKRTLTYNIDSDEATFKMELSAQQDYIVIDELDDSKPLVVKLKVNGQPLTPEEFARVKLEVKCDKIEYTLTPNESDSSYSIKLGATKGIDEGKYPIEVNAIYTDAVGRPGEASSAVTVTLSNTPLWVKWLIGILLAILLTILAVIIARIKVLPSKKKVCAGSSRSLIMGGKTVTKDNDTILTARRSGKTLNVTAGNQKGNFTICMSGIEPASKSFLCKSSKKRSFMVNPESVVSTGKIEEVTIGGTKFIPEKGMLKPKKPTDKYEFNSDDVVKIKGKNNQQKPMIATIPINFNNER